VPAQVLENTFAVMLATTKHKQTTKWNKHEKQTNADTTVSDGYEHDHRFEYSGTST